MCLVLRIGIGNSGTRLIAHAYYMLEYVIAHAQMKFMCVM
jgi:hypothetical protein